MTEFDPAGPLVRRQRRRRRAGRPRMSGLSWLALGLGLGLVGGLLYAWLINPIVYVEASPARFNAAAQDEYIFLVSQSYAVSGDLARAQTRLAALDAPDAAARVELVLERFLREGRRAEHVASLARLEDGLFPPADGSTAAEGPAD